MNVDGDEKVILELLVCKALGVPRWSSTQHSHSAVVWAAGSRAKNVLCGFNCPDVEVGESLPCFHNSCEFIFSYLFKANKNDTLKLCFLNQCRNS